MNSSILIIFAAISLILATVHNARGSGLKTRNKRMTNSQSDVDNSFKHEAYITNNGEYVCTGTIISDEFVLTAASCVTKERSIDINDVIQVRAGIKTYNPFEFHVVRLVEEIYIPKCYFIECLNENEENLSNDNWDIAVLKLNHELGLERDPRIELLLLPTSNFEEQQRSEENDLIFTAFGINDVNYDPSKNEVELKSWPVYLQYSKARVSAPFSCDLKGSSEKYKMCAHLLHKDNNAGVCYGDIGGALFDRNEKTIIGVLSYASSECSGEKPGVYTRVSPHYIFIFNAIVNTTDPEAVHVSFAGFPNYENALNQNPWKYHWIYPANSLMFENLLLKLNQ